MNPVVKLGDNVHFNLTDNQKMLSHQRNDQKGCVTFQKPKKLNKNANTMS